MAHPPITLAEAKRRIHAVERALRKGHAPTGVAVNSRRGERSAARVALEACGLPPGSQSSWLQVAERAYRPIDWSQWKRPAPPPEPEIPAAAAMPPAPSAAPLPDRLVRQLRRGAMAPAALASSLGAAPAEIADAAKRLQARGFAIVTAADSWRLDRAPVAAVHDGPRVTFEPLPGTDTYRFGLSGDQHLGSRYERPDVLDRLYDDFAEAGCQAVLNTGNWIDGEARFNVHDLHTHGLDGQVRHLVAQYPSRPGLTTYAVWGADHEGWYANREGIDVGRFVAGRMADGGRTDWVDLGLMEAPILLRHPLTGASAVALVQHPGGGSAYALSYSMQKIIESLDGGEKPAALFAGHYHKLWAGNIRNVWVAQTGCTQDQTPFMRQKKIEAHVGGCIVELTQDPATGALVRCKVEILRYFNRGYYADRWSKSGEPRMLPRSLAGAGR